MSPDGLESALDRAYPAGSAARDRRTDALAEFRARGFPTRRAESWRYTDLGRVTGAGLDYSKPKTDAAAIAAAADAVAALPLDAAAPLAVFVDGVLAPDLSRLDGAFAAALTIGMRDEPAEAPSAHALAALAAAFADPVALTLGADGAARAPLTLVFIAATPGLATQHRLRIDVAADARATLTLYFIDVGGESPGWTNVYADVTIGAGASLDMSRVQCLEPGQSLTMLLAPTLAADATLTLGTIDAGGGLVRTDVETVLAGPGAGVELFGLAMAGDGQHIDNHVCADHRSADTHSLQTFRSIVDSGGRAVFNGKVVVRQDAQRIDAHQTSDNLLLAANAEVDTKPELEIYADDVRCSHGATVGEIDENEIFYLCSRGLPADTAQRLLTLGFANRILGRIAQPPLRQWIGRRVAGTLAEEDTIEAAFPDGDPE